MLSVASIAPLIRHWADVLDGVNDESMMQVSSAWCLWARALRPEPKTYKHVASIASLIHNWADVLDGLNYESMMQACNWSNVSGEALR